LAVAAERERRQQGEDERVRIAALVERERHERVEAARRVEDARLWQASMECRRTDLALRLLNARRREREEFERWLVEQEQLRQEGGFQVLSGEKVLEILPESVSKRSAIQKILLLPGFIGLFPVYLGDDTTDESAFLLLQGHGMTVKVGRPGTETAASHSLADTKAVRHFLSLLTAPLEDF